MKKRQLISLDSKKAEGLMKWIITIVILVIFLGLIAFLYLDWGRSGVSLAKYARDIFWLGT